ncbi:TapB family protein [Parvicella tangerina]|uniref:DUF3108 domain-containing protein n=1 Tax=Parvicella tangerina TaxID=2829795 RepID=A0A916JKV1_9FLAO|nr:hypothetical protein [Parvicella tangerina]CAG5079401.1 hypothetical protein CRYO30217_00935 [Parvicella tangerina]
MEKTIFNLRNIVSSIFVMLFFLTLGSAQDCASFMPMEEGYKWEVTNFNKKGKEQGTVTHTVKSASVEGGVANAELEMVTSDGKEEHSTTYQFMCEGSTFKMSMNIFLPDETMEQMQNMESMEVEMDMEDMEFPTVLEVGQELKDANMTMEAKMNGMKVMSMTTLIKDRKVVAKESVTTSAGTYECFKVEQVSAIKMGFVNREYKSVSYIAEGVGVVRSESYDKKGNLDSYSEITKIY